MRPHPEKEWPHLAQVIVDDRLAAIDPQRLDLLTNPHPAQPRVVLQQPVDLVLERIQLRRYRRPLIPRRLRRTHRASDRVPIDPITPRELLDPNPTNEMLPPKLGPTLHVKHTLLPGSINKNRASVNRPPDASTTALNRGASSTGGGG
jgi:hypothetical protein